MRARAILEHRSKGVDSSAKTMLKYSFDRPRIKFSLMIMYQTYFNTSFDLFSNTHILKPSSNWSPYMFTLVQKVNIGYTKFMLLNEAILCETLQVISLKMMCTSCTDEI